MLVVINIFVQCFKIGGLLYCRTGGCPHHESVPTIYPIGGVKSCEPFAFLADRNAPICAESVNSQVILVAVQLLDFIYSKRDGASIWLETLVDQSVHTNSKPVIRIALFLTGSEFGCYDQT